MLIMEGGGDIIEANGHHEMLDQNDTIRLRLSGQKMEVLQLMGRGLSNSSIASERGVSENTIKSQVNGIGRILGAKNRTNAVLVAVNKGILDINDLTKGLDARGLESLSPTQNNILKVILNSNGLICKNAEIGETLGITINTVKTHRRSILDKFELKNRQTVSSAEIVETTEAPGVIILCVLLYMKVQKDADAKLKTS